MDAESIKRLPVVDEHGQLVGIVSRGDVLRLFLRPDEDIQREVRDEALLRTLWIDPTDITVDVTQGVVTLGGTLDRRSTIALVKEIVQGVAGVVDVVSNLSYHYDDRNKKVDPPAAFPIVRRDRPQPWPRASRARGPDRTAPMPESPSTLRFLGAIGTVTGSRFLLETGQAKL